MRPLAPLFAVVLLAPAAARAERCSVPYEMFRLKNGLTVIVHEDHSAPIASVNCWYHVGSARPGRTGFAHLFEHLMFEGSKDVPEGAFDQWLEAVGGDNNGSTQNDRTNYWENVPANAVDLPLFLESDRMATLVDAMSPQKVDGQRGVVKNERRQSHENRALRQGRGRVARGALPSGAPVLVAGDRGDGRPVRGELPGRRRLLQEVVRPRQREPGDRRGREHEGGPGGGREVVRGHPEERARPPSRASARCCSRARSASSSRTVCSSRGSTSRG